MKLVVGTIIFIVIQGMPLVLTYVKTLVSNSMMQVELVANLFMIE